jgi:acyl-CoA thioester hydrolase
LKNNVTFKNILPIQVRFSDIDVMGHVSNTVYQSYYDSGKIHYFNLVLPDMDFVNLGVVGASIKIDYFKPIFMKTRILVETRVAEIGNKSLIMEHNLIDECSKEVLSTCKAVLVCYSIKEQQSIPIPGNWKKNILSYDEGVIVR